LESVKKLYLNQDVIKINEMSYSRESIIKTSYLPVYGFFSEIIDFVLIVDKQEKIDIAEKMKGYSVAKSVLNPNQAAKNSNI